MQSPRITATLGRVGVAAIMSVVMFWVIYAPRWAFLDGDGGFRYLLLILLLLNIDLKILLRPESVPALTISTTTLTLYVWLAGVIIVFACIPIVHSSYDFSLSTQLIRAVPLYIVFAWLIHRLWVKWNWDLNRLLWVMSSVIFLQAIAIVLDWIFPEVRSAFQNIVVHPESLRVTSLRAAGLSSSTGDGLVFIQSCGAMFSYYLLTRTIEFWLRAALSLFFWVQVVSMVFLGRTGFVLLTAFIAVYFLLSPDRREQVRTLIRLSFIPALAIAGFYVLMPELFLAVIRSDQLGYAFEFIYRYLEEGRLATTSSDDVLTDFFLPFADATLWFGHGYYTNPISGSNYVDADPGYVRTLFYAGIIGSIVVYGWFLLLWRAMLGRCDGQQIKAFISSFFIVLFIAHLKFPFLYSGAVIAFLSLFYVFLGKARRSHEALGSPPAARFRAMRESKAIAASDLSS